MDQDSSRPRYPDPYQPNQQQLQQRQQSQQQHSTLQGSVVGSHVFMSREQHGTESMARAGSNGSQMYGITQDMPFGQPSTTHQSYIAQDQSRQQQYSYASSVPFATTMPHDQIQHASQQQFRPRPIETYSETQPAQYYTDDQPGPSTTTTSNAGYGAPQAAVSHYQAATYAPSMPVGAASSTFLGAMFEPMQQTVYQSFGQQHNSLPISHLGQQASPPQPHQQQQQHLQQQQQQQQQQQHDRLQQAFVQYQYNIKTVFSLVQGRALRDIPSPLMEASRFLLGSAEALGLTRDEEGLHDERIVLWDEYNRAWLTTMQCQFDMIQEMQSGRSLHATQSTLDYETLESLSTELVRLCDGIEKYGLVDYQMGVAEDEIIEVTLRCLSQLESSSSNEDSGNSDEL